MMKRMFFFAFIGVLIHLASCKKTDIVTVKKETGEAGKTVKQTGQSSRTTEEGIMDELIQNYGLHVLSTQEMATTQFPQFTSYEEAASYIDQRLADLNQQVNDDAGIDHGPMPVKYWDPPPGGPCSPAGFYHATLPGSGGFFSHFSVYFNTSGSGVSSASIYVSGTPIGWSWSQVAQGFNGYCGCVGGTITNGLQIGNITIGWQQNYHFSMCFGTNCILTFSQGGGSC